MNLTQSCESVNSYTARTKVFFKANYIPEDKQLAIFLICVGAKTYDVLVGFDTLDTATLDSLFTALQDHYTHLAQKCISTSCSILFNVRP